MENAEILVVDDNPADSDLICEVLRDDRRCAHASVVEDGVQALSFLRQEGKYREAHAPDLMVLDLNLPCKDGREVLAEVKSDGALRKIPVIIFTTSQRQQDVARTYELGANCYLSKPGNLEDFVAAVKSLEDFWLGHARFP